MIFFSIFTIFFHHQHKMITVHKHWMTLPPSCYHTISTSSSYHILLVLLNSTALKLPGNQTIMSLYKVMFAHIFNITQWGFLRRLEPWSSRFTSLANQTEYNPPQTNTVDTLRIFIGCNRLQPVCLQFYGPNGSITSIPTTGWEAGRELSIGCNLTPIVGDEAHPLHQCYSKLRSGIRFKSMRGRTKRYLTSFVPASITHFNSLCRRWKYVGWLELQLCMCIMSYLGYFTYDIDSV